MFSEFKSRIISPIVRTDPREDVDLIKFTLGYVFGFRAGKRGPFCLKPGRVVYLDG